MSKQMFKYATHGLELNCFEFMDNENTDIHMVRNWTTYGCSFIMMSEQFRSRMCLDHASVIKTPMGGLVYH